MKEIAEQLFIQLNEAYEKNDIQTVTKILAELEQGIFRPRSETVSENLNYRQLLPSHSKITRIEKEIFEMKESEAYATIIDIEDWDQYFANTKNN